MIDHSYEGTLTLSVVYSKSAFKSVFTKLKSYTL